MWVFPRLAIPLVVLCLLLAALTVAAQGPVADALFDVVLPWDDGSETAVDIGGIGAARDRR